MFGDAARGVWRIAVRAVWSSGTDGMKVRYKVAATPCLTLSLPGLSGERPAFSVPVWGRVRCRHWSHNYEMYLFYVTVRKKEPPLLELRHPCGVQIAPTNVLVGVCFIQTSLSVKMLRDRSKMCVCTARVVGVTKLPPHVMALSRSMSTRPSRAILKPGRSLRFGTLFSSVTTWFNQEDRPC